MVAVWFLASLSILATVCCHARKATDGAGTGGSAADGSAGSGGTGGAVNGGTGGAGTGGNPGGSGGIGGAPAGGSGGTATGGMSGMATGGSSGTTVSTCGPTGVNCSTVGDQCTYCGADGQGNACRCGSGGWECQPSAAVACGVACGDRRCLASELCRELTMGSGVPAGPSSLVEYSCVPTPPACAGKTPNCACAAQATAYCSQAHLCQCEDKRPSALTCACKAS